MKELPSIIEITRLIKAVWCDSEKRTQIVHSVIVISGTIAILKSISMSIWIAVVCVIALLSCIYVVSLIFSQYGLYQIFRRASSLIDSTIKGACNAVLMLVFKVRIKIVLVCSLLIVVINLSAVKLGKPPEVLEHIERAQPVAPEPQGPLPNVSERPKESMPETPPLPPQSPENQPSGKTPDAEKPQETQLGSKPEPQRPSEPNTGQGEKPQEPVLRSSQQLKPLPKPKKKKVYPTIKDLLRRD